MPKPPLVSTSYLGNIAYYALLAQNQSVWVEYHEHFVKQTYRNRCHIYGANGMLDLIIPLKKWKNQTPVRKIEIAYYDKWQDLHWRSITAAYRSSPYFEFYETDLRPFYDTASFECLIDFNQALFKKISELIGLDTQLQPTKSYQQHPQDLSDFRSYFTPKKKTIYGFRPYTQVFSDKYGHLENLSILDLLCNLGPESLHYLKNSKVV